jgi:hypothetical protein
MTAPSCGTLRCVDERARPQRRYLQDVACRAKARTSWIKRYLVHSGHELRRYLPAVAVIVLHPNCSQARSQVFARLAVPERQGSPRRAGSGTRSSSERSCTNGRSRAGARVHGSRRQRRIRHRRVAGRIHPRLARRRRFRDRRLRFRYRRRLWRRCHIGTRRSPRPFAARLSIASACGHQRNPAVGGCGARAIARDVRIAKALDGAVVATGRWNDQDIQPVPRRNSMGDKTRVAVLAGRRGPADGLPTNSRKRIGRRFIIESWHVIVLTRNRDEGRHRTKIHSHTNGIQSKEPAALPKELLTSR